jgi:hypothetical protein
MALRTVLTDENNNEMECYLNDEGKVYINVGESGQDIHYSGYITLNKEDVNHLIKMLTDLESEMEY